MEDFWNDKYVLMDLLLETNMSMAEIAKDLGVTQSFLTTQMKQLGLTWIKRRTQKMSRGQASLTATLKKLLPNEHVENEYHIGEMLRLDVYCRAYSLAIEYHGRQHYEFLNRFYDSYEDFVRAQERDRRKEEMCKESGITLVIFKYNDDLSEDVVYDRILTALQQDVGLQPATPHRRPKREKRSLKTENNALYEEIKKKRREYGKEMRERMKDERKLRAQLER